MIGANDVVNPAASKGAGVAATAAELGASPDEIMAIGDNYNDLEMLLFAGTGVVMANAPLSLREIGAVLRKTLRRHDARDRHRRRRDGPDGEDLVALRARRAMSDDDS